MSARKQDRDIVAIRDNILVHTCRVRVNHNEFLKNVASIDREKLNVDYIQKLTENYFKLEQAHNRESYEAFLKEVRPHFKLLRDKAIDKTTKTAPVEALLTMFLILQNEQYVVMTPSQLQLETNKMADYPVLLQSLQAYANRHSMSVGVIDPDMYMKAIDNFEFNIMTLAGEIYGDVEACRPTIRELDKYFQPDETYINSSDWKNSDEAFDHFWADKVQIGSPDMFSSESSGTACTVKYYFSDMDGMLEFIHSTTEGMSKEEGNAKAIEIINDCPEEYQTAYRVYKASGEKLPLNQSENTQED